MDQVFRELIKECEHCLPGTQLSYALRRALEKYGPKERKKIVSLLMNGCAPLFIACKRGLLEVVKYLVTVCHADIEQKGQYVVPDDRSLHYVTPLWCAAVSGKLPVVKYLISQGANVNTASDSASTPVRSACFMTRIDVVSYLVENGADILKANCNGGTCLINAIQSVELCIFLLNCGADVNATDIQNKTALHYAIQEHRFQTTKLLLKHNADPYLKSRYNDDALQTACLKGAVQIFEYLIATVSYTPERLADAYELLGSTCFDDHNNTQTALSYWRTALAIRSANPVNGVPLPKRPVLEKRDAYRNATEFTTLEELETIALDLDAMRIQSLLICERILGPHHKDTPFRLMLRGALYVDAFRYQNCIDLWRRALEIRVEKDSILHTDTCFTAKALVKLMLDFNEKTLVSVYNEVPRFGDVVAVFKLLQSQVSDARKLLEMRPVYRRQEGCYARILKCITHLIYLLIETGTSDDEKALTKQLVRQAVKEDPGVVYKEDTLLHLCVSTQTLEIFPCYKVVKLLLDCGANVNAKNECRSTPLHIASNTFKFQNSIIKLLLDYGAHLDIPNRKGEMPIKFISANPKNNVNLVNYLSLQCYAAQAVHKYLISEWGKYDVRKIPVTLHKFLELHEQ